MTATTSSFGSSSPRSLRSRVSLAFGLVTLAGVGIVMVHTTVMTPLAEHLILGNSIALAILIAISAIGIGLGLSAAFRTRAAAGITGTIANGVSVIAAILVFSSIVFPDAQSAARSRGHNAHYNKQIMATGRMWLPITEGSVHTIAFNPATPNREVFVEIKGEEIVVVVKYRNGVFASTASPDDIPIGSGDDRLSFTPSTTEEHSIEIAPRSGSKKSVIRQITVWQNIRGL